MATINEILNAIKVSRDQGFSEADIATGLARYGITASQIENATATTYTPTQIENAINVSRQQGFSDADITTGLAKYGITTAQPYVDTNSGRATGLTDPSKFTPSTYTPEQIADAIKVSRQQGFSEADVATGLGRFLPNAAAVTAALAANPKALPVTPTTYTPAQIADAIKVSRQQGFSEADIITGLGRFLPNAAAVTAALAANPKASTVTPTTLGAITPIVRPAAMAQPSYTQLTPASVTNTAIANTPYTNVYTPATMQRNAPTLAQISAASQSANPYQSLMALTPQRSMSPAYAGMLGQTTANTNLGGFDPAIYNPAATPVTGLLNTTVRASDGAGGNVSSNAGGSGGGFPGATMVGGISGPTTGIASGANSLAAFLGNLGLTSISDAIAKSVDPNFSHEGRAGRGSSADQANAALSAAEAAAADQSGTGGFTSGANSDGYGGGDLGAFLAKGGMVNMKPQRHNPPGPDDGYAALENGEYVIRKRAVKKYGENIFEQINAGRIPAQRLKSPLE